MDEVEKVFKEIGALDIPQIVVFNKIDLVDRAPFITEEENGQVKAVALSAKTGEGIELLKQAVAEIARKKEEEYGRQDDVDDEDWLKEFEP